MFKVIDTSNFNLESVADELIAENISDVTVAQQIAHRQNEGRDGYSPMWATVVPQSQRLSRGMEDLV